ncbi:hypothetical protein CB1_000353012 [Camelus ferus]|nr:hypothetical protein CB1_000353012 [Camelus ferus]
MEWKTRLSLSPNLKSKKSLPKEELVSTDLDETAGGGNLAKRKKSFPQEEPVSDPEESGPKRACSRRKRTCSKEEPLSSGPEQATASKSSGSKKRGKLYLRKLRMDSSLMGHSHEEERRCGPSGLMTQEVCIGNWYLLFLQTARVGQMDQQV